MLPKKKTDALSQLFQVSFDKIHHVFYIPYMSKIPGAAS